MYTYYQIGKLTEEGNFNELINKNGVFHKLWQLQFGKIWFLPAFKLQTISPFGKFAMVTHNSRQAKRL